MNEQIKKLAEKAFESAHKENGNMPMMLEKFAELIIQECASVMQKNVNLNYDHCLDQQIFNHFGMEQVPVNKPKKPSRK